MLAGDVIYVLPINWQNVTDKMKLHAALVGEKMVKLAEKVWWIASKIIAAVVSIGLFLAAPYFFAAGAILGFIITVFLPQKVPRVIAAIQVIWTTQPWLTIAAMSIAAFLCLPVTVAASSLLWGAYIGSELSLKAQALLGYQRHERLPAT